jgi:3-phosphoshikimate 1-carboxyvinyltransferase
MQKTIKFVGEINGELHAPPSKSHSQRLLAGMLLAKGKSILHNFGHSDDEIAALNILKMCGAEVLFLSENSIEINSDGLPDKELTILCGESGLSCRMFTAILASQNQLSVIEGTESILNRNMRFFEEIFQKLNIPFQSNNGKLPFKISGPFFPKNIEIDSTESSQYITGLLYLYALAEHNEPHIISLKNNVSKPYLDLTVETLSQFGIEIHGKNNRYTFEKTQIFHPIEAMIEGDWSSAAYFLVAGALYGSITMHGLQINSKQADRKIIDVLKRCGTNVTFSNNSITISKQNLIGFEFDATDCPDLFPILAVLALRCEGTTTLKGVKRLYNKESNRASVIYNEINNLGGEIAIMDDIMIIKGGQNFNKFFLKNHKDHRIVLAFSIFALGNQEDTIIEDISVVSKSYPNFFKDLYNLVKI